jgi:transcription termination/antitermination protein NusG
MDGIIDEPTRHWWAVQVRAGREQLAARHLRLRGYEIFVPCYLAHRRWSDRIKKVERPLFAGYLFCAVPQAKVGKVVTTPSVIRVLGDSRGPLPIPHAEIDAVRRITETRLAVSPWPFVQIGQKVRVEVGPLRDMEGIVLATKSGRRLIVSIPLLNRSAAVELNADWISVPLPSVVGDRPRGACLGASDHADRGVIQ